MALTSGFCLTPRHLYAHQVSARLTHFSHTSKRFSSRKAHEDVLAVHKATPKENTTKANYPCARDAFDKGGARRRATRLILVALHRMRRLSELGEMTPQHNSQADKLSDGYGQILST